MNRNEKQNHDGNAPTSSATEGKQSILGYLERQFVKNEMKLVKVSSRSDAISRR